MDATGNARPGVTTPVGVRTRDAWELPRHLRGGDEAPSPCSFRLRGATYPMPRDLEPRAPEVDRRSAAGASRRGGAAHYARYPANPSGRIQAWGCLLSAWEVIRERAGAADSKSRRRSRQRRT